MKLYIDESGNTGETLTKDSKYNFREQPYFVLAGILINKNEEKLLENFITQKRALYKIQSNEFKARKLYDKRNKFITETIDFLIENKIHFFVELMEKSYYLNVQILENIILPFKENTDESIHMRKVIASNLDIFFNDEVYQKFIDTCKTYTSNALEDFLHYLIAYLQGIIPNSTEDFKESIVQLKGHIELTLSDFLEMKSESINSYKLFLPKPSLNPHNKLVHLLPNYHCFSNLIGRTEKCVLDNSLGEYAIIHDEQKEFGVIFEETIAHMKTVDTNQLIKGTFAEDIVSYNLPSNLKLSFEDSKTNIFLQVSDILGGFTMKFWNDFVNNNMEKIALYSNTFKKLVNLNSDNHNGINFVVKLTDTDKLAKDVLGLNFKFIQKSSL